MHPPNTFLPPETESSRLLRAKLSREWWSEAFVLERLRIDGSTLNNLRTERHIVAAWDASSRAWRYPPFQFLADNIALQIAPLLQYIVDRGNADGWDEIEWLYSNHALLDGQKPVDAFVSNPDLVLAVAKREFVDERDTNW